MSVLHLKNDHRFRTIRLPKRERVEISLRITDRRYPERMRWYAQWGVMAGAGGRALKGFTNDLARRHLWHEFYVKPENVAKCVLEFGDLIELGKIDLLVGGQPVRMRHRGGLPISEIGRRTSLSRNTINT